jgi:GDP-L-fucose synthase
MTYDLAGKRIWVCGHRGMVGAALVRRLRRDGIEPLVASRQELDLTRQAQVEDWMAANRPDAVIVAAAKVGGIVANDTYPAEFLYENLMIEANVIHAAWKARVEKLLFLGSSCIYPRLAPQPIPEDALLTGPLEPTNEWYAIAKIAGIKLCQAYMRQYGARFISAMPTNLYGPGDNYHAQNSHVIPALLRKAHEAKLKGESGMEIWGTGAPLREFMHVHDLADACVFLLQRYEDYEHINIGSGEEISIAELGREVMRVVALGGELRNDTTKPDGTPRKLMSSDRIRAMGWRPSTTLTEGLSDAYRWFVAHEREAVDRNLRPAAPDANNQSLKNSTG